MISMKITCDKCKKEVLNGPAYEVNIQLLNTIPSAISNYMPYVEKYHICQDCFKTLFSMEDSQK